jgi:non-specific protein-tyrosine kinase
MGFKQYISPLIKWWWLILASTTVAVLASIYAVSQQLPVYQARTTLMLGQAINNPNPTGNEFYLGQQLAQTYADLAKREPVKDATMETLGLDWLPSYTVNVVPSTMLIELTLNDTSPERAMVITNELAKQIILRSPTSAQELEDKERQDFIKTQLDDLEIQIEATKAEIDTKQAELAALFSSRQIADLQTQIGALQAKQTSLQNNYASLLTNSQQGAINSLSIFEPATLPVQPVGPHPITTVATAAVFGFILGAAAAYLLEFLDDTIKTPEDVSKSTDLPTLAGIAVYEVKGEDKYEVVTQTKPRSPISEAYRTLRTAILFANVDRSTCSILVTSANPSEGKSSTVANLGVVMAQAGHRVLIVDADLRRPVQHIIFRQSSNNYGLTNLLVKMLIDENSEDSAKDTHALLEGAIHETTQSALYLLTSGSLPPNPAELVGSAKMQSLLEMLTELFDYIIIDGPPSLAVTDPVVLSTRTDSVLLVSHAGSIRKNQLEAAVEQLREVKANLIGVVLNRVSAKTSGYYYYNYYNTSYYQNDEIGDNESHSKRKNLPAGERKPGFLARMFGQ